MEPYSFFQRGTEGIPFKLFSYAVVVLIILITYGIVGSIIIMDLDPINAIYFTIITIATVGYGDIVPVTVIEKLFSVTLALGGVGLITYVFSLSISIVGETVTEITSGSRLKRKIAKLENHYILCGHGRVGDVVLKELKKRNKKVVVIEKNSKIAERLWEDERVLAINGDATEDEVLKEAGINSAYGLILSTGEDVDNLFIALTSRELAPDIWIVSRASRRENVKRLLNSGANKVISPEESGGKDIYFAAMEPTMVKITTKHDFNDIGKEMEIIIDYGCSVESIEYHFPQFTEPLTRRIEASSKEEIEKFIEKVETKPGMKKSLNNIYSMANGIHSHWVSGPNKETLNRLIKELEKEDLVLGIDLDDVEIQKLTKEYAES
ncbi:MAG: NAD-binding protein [Methanobacteriaceae archaeon]